MAASWCTILLGKAGNALEDSVPLRRLLWVQATPATSFLQLQQPHFRIYSTEADPDGSTEPAAFNMESPFKEKPWEYLETEEYIERYGDKPVWFGYRRNHKGPIPPQKTRKQCIRGGKACGNPCPICRDTKLHVDYRNVKLLEQFVCSHTGITWHPTYTGICMKQYKQLTNAIQMAQENGLMSCHIPFTDFRGADYSNQHASVSKTPPSPALQSKTAWYEWYEWQQPLEKDIARIRRIYKNFLKEESSPT
uniref:Small ribosomal subunit protein mS40 n=1 Tax=Sphenodon punctatus TaxID=8508 RepID=A0A8D0HIF8_SPHPU